MDKKYIRIAVVLGILMVAGIASYLLIPTQPEVVAPEIPAITPEEVQPEIPEAEPVASPGEELHLDGVILRNSGDTNPFFGTPWIYVGCTGYVGEPIVAVDAEILAIVDTLKEAGLKPGQNILYTGEEKQPSGPPVKLLIQWNDGSNTKTLDMSQIIFDKTTGKPLSAIDEPFVFLGSYVVRGELESERTGCIACTVNCPNSLFSTNKANSGYHMERSRYYIPEGILPQVGTKVTVIIRWGSELDSGKNGDK
ncbi:MAG TPA: hypothetical protein G4O12_06560 [Dehalococcoidia bacterium]|nr:hypothetical protein [Dehalococcoidia bacterium]